MIIRRLLAVSLILTVFTAFTACGNMGMDDGGGSDASSGAESSSSLIDGVSSAIDDVVSGPSSQSENGSGESPMKQSLEDIVNGIYSIAKPKFDVKTTKIDVNNADMLRYFTGIDDGKIVKEAVVSESKDESHAYSLAVVKLKDSSDARKIADDMKSKIDTARFEGKTVDIKEIAVYDDTVMLVLMDSTLDGEISGGAIVDAFHNSIKA